MPNDVSTLTNTARLSVAILVASLTSPTAFAGESGSAAAPWKLQADAGYVNQFESSLDTGGDFEADRYFLRLGLSRRLGNAWNAGIAVGYGEADYEFSGPGGFAGMDPWGKVRELRVSAPLRYRADNDWSFIAIPTLRYYEESGADGSGRQLGLLAAGAYRVSERLTIGPGFGVFSGLEESTDFFPILFIDWQIADDWRLETGKGLASSRGPGISLKWQPTAQWSFSLAARYEKTRFRLDDSGIAAGGVGQDKSVPVGLSATYAAGSDVNFTLLGGVELAGSLELEDRNGNLLAESDYDPAPFVGLLLNATF